MGTWEIFGDGYFGHEVNDGISDLGRKCLRCGHIEIYGPCGNCGGTHYKWGESRGYEGTFCENCGKGSIRWTCRKCGTDNPTNKTLVVRYLSR